MSYVGNTPTTQSFISGTDYFNGTGSQTAFTLSRTVVSPNDVEAVINNVVQQPNSAYTISGTTITFTSAPSAGTSNIYVRYLSTTTQSITPSQNTVSYSTLNSDTQSKLGIMYKNRIINGAMVIDQRNAGASVTAVNGAYNVDRWIASSATTSVFSVQQSTTAPAGFNNSLLVTSLASTSITSGLFYSVQQIIEGYNIADLGFGTASAKTVTLSFWVRSSLTGTFSGCVQNGDVNRSYPFTYTISTANTWEQKSVTIPGDTTGTWATTNTAGMFALFSLGIGSTRQGTANTWSTGNYRAVAGETPVVGTSGATWYVTGVQLEVGTQATTFTNAGGSYGGELALCQRYYETSFPLGTAPSVGGAGAQDIGSIAYASSVNRSGTVFYKVSKRAQSSTITLYGPSGYGASLGNYACIYIGGAWSNWTSGAVGNNTSISFNLDGGTPAGTSTNSSYLTALNFAASCEL